MNLKDVNELYINGKIELHLTFPHLIKKLEKPPDKIEIKKLNVFYKNNYIGYVPYKLTKELMGEYYDNLLLKLLELINKPRYNIAISGPHCSGKSTLINELKKLDECKEFYFTESPSTKMVDKVNLSENSNDSQQLLYLFNTVKTFDDTIDKTIVYDRCAFDVYVYSKYLYNKNKITKETYDDVYRTHKRYLKQINKIILLLNYSRLISNNIRSMDIEYLKEINKLFLETLEKDELLKKKVIVIESNSSVEDKVNEFLKILQ